MNRLKELRKETKLSLRQLQEYVGIDFSRLGKLEKNDLNVESNTLEKLLNFFMVDYYYFQGKGGLVYFYDAHKKQYFPLSYNQFKSLFEKFCYTVEIADSSVRRILTDEGLKLIGETFRAEQISLDKKIKFYQMVDELKKCDDLFLEDLKEEIDSILFSRLINKQK